jgi:hypothetical protein
MLPLLLNRMGKNAMQWSVETRVALRTTEIWCRLVLERQPRETVERQL